MKRILSLALAIALTVLCLPIIGASAATVDIAVDGATLTLDNCLGITFLVKASKLSAYGSSFMSVTFPRRDGTPEDFVLDPTDLTVDGVAYKAYYFGGIAPDDMGVAVTAQLHAVKGAATYDAGSFAYAVTDYILNMAGSSRALDDLMGDVLAYGKAAEAYTARASIPNDDRVTALLTKAESDVVADTAASDVKHLDYPNGVTSRSAIMKFSTAGVNLRDNAALVYTFEPKAGYDAGNYSLKLSVDGHADEIVPLSAGQTVYRFRGLSATETGKTVRAVFVDGNGDPVSAYLDYSVESYAYHCYKNRASDPALNALTQALIRYGKAIDAYADAPFELPFHKGININCMEGEPYSTSTLKSTYYLSRDDTYTNIKAKGFDYVRFPVCLSKYYDASTGALNTTGSYRISDVDTVINKALAAGLYIILDFHDWDFNGTGAVFAANDADQRALFVSIWEKLAIRYRDYSDRLVFELINEPARNTSSAYNLNLAQNAAIAKIRETNPDRIILATITDASQPWLLTNNGGADSLSLTAGTTRVGLVIHCYNPGEFTHQGTNVWGSNWAQHDHQVRLTDAHRNTLRWDLNQIKSFMDAHPDIPVNVNEFSVMQRLADKGDLTEYLTMVREWCEDNYVPWGYWQYIGNDQMGARSSYSGSWYSYVLEGLGLN